MKGEILKKLIKYYTMLPMQDPTTVPLLDNGS